MLHENTRTTTIRSHNSVPTDPSVKDLTFIDNFQLHNSCSQGLVQKGSKFGVWLLWLMLFFGSYLEKSLHLHLFIKFKNIWKKKIIFFVNLPESINLKMLQKPNSVNSLIKNAITDFFWHKNKIKRVLLLCRLTCTWLTHSRTSAQVCRCCTEGVKGKITHPSRRSC